MTHTATKTPLASGTWLLGQNGHTRYVKAAGNQQCTLAWRYGGAGDRQSRANIDRHIRQGRYTVITAQQRNAWDTLPRWSTRDLDAVEAAALTAEFLASLAPSRQPKRPHDRPSCAHYLAGFEVVGFEHEGA